MPEETLAPPRAVADVVQWDARYALGLPEIDEQHQELFNIINDVWRVQVLNSGSEALDAIIARLERYTQQHFSAEEALMSAENYPQLAAHCAAHRQFIERVARERKTVRERGAVSLDLLHFLRDWLLRHIRESDADYARHIERAHQRPGFSLKRFFSRLVG